MGSGEKRRFWLLLGAVGLFLIILKNGHLAFSVINWFYQLVSPFLIGLAIAFVLNVFLTPLEAGSGKLFRISNTKWWGRWGRGISVLLLYVLTAGVIFILASLVIPELKKSISLLAEQLPEYLQKLGNFLEEQSRRLSDWTGQIVNIGFRWRETLKGAAEQAQNMAPGVFTVTVEMATELLGGTFRLVLALVFSAYMLLQKERLCDGLRQLLTAFLAPKKAELICDLGRLCRIVFARFVKGQLTEAVILGSLCFVGMAVFSIPYAALISCIVGATALIPIFGAFLGAGFGGFLLLVSEPKMALWFLIFIIILQQLEGNLIYPKVVGESVGLPAIWVLFAVMAGGSLGGIWGMLIGIPLASVLYGLLKQVVAERLSSQQSPTRSPVDRNGVSGK